LNSELNLEGNHNRSGVEPEQGGDSQWQMTWDATNGENGKVGDSACGLEASVCGRWCPAMGAKIGFKFMSAGWLPIRGSWKCRCLCQPQTITEKKNKKPWESWLSSGFPLDSPSRIWQKWKWIWWLFSRRNL